MTFKKGDPRPPGAGNKKGSKHKKTMFREAYEDKFGDDLPSVLGTLSAEAINEKDVSQAIELMKLALPYCHKKMPIDHAFVDEKGISVDYTAILIANNIEPRKPKGEN